MVEIEKKTQEEAAAKDKFAVIKRILRFWKDGTYGDETVLSFFAGFVGHLPSEEDLKMEG